MSISRHRRTLPRPRPPHRSRRPHHQQHAAAGSPRRPHRHRRGRNLIATLASDFTSARRSPSIRLPSVPRWQQPAAGPQPHQDGPLQHHDGAVLARLPVQLRVLRHHRDLRPPPAHQGGRAGAARTRPAARPAGATPSSSSTTTSSATRSAPRNSCRAWPSGAGNTAIPSASSRRRRSTSPTMPNCSAVQGRPLRLGLPRHRNAR